MSNYPPLTPVEEYPLHGWDYNAEYACRKAGSLVFDWRCPVCVEEARHADPNTETYWKQNAGLDEQRVTLGWLVARSTYHGVGVPDA